MKHLITSVLIACFYGLWLSPGLATDNTIQHEITIQLSPETHHLQVSDQITLPAGFTHETVFSLHRGLSPYSANKDVKITPLAAPENSIWAPFRLNLPDGINTFTLEYAGEIDHPLDGYGEEQARGFRHSPGLISGEGVFLAGSSHWYPQFDGDTRLKFTLNTELPENWLAVSQGQQSTTHPSSWQSDSPQEEIYLIAARFTEYQRQVDNINMQVFLREADAALADQYLTATAKYLKLYESLLGAYPYSKFALVENFWETGFGMPSFTLLGSKVIRLPFILHSSYPHEILHNWWGNGVYVDYTTGNWSEGLTAYLADHLIKEQQGKGVSYRQQSLQKYADYAASQRDFPLNQFRGRHSSASEAVGYGKTLMLFHMLRQQLSDRTFITALQTFYQQHLFRTSSFNDLRVAFETTSGESLSGFFDQWVNRRGSPVLTLTNSYTEPCGNEHCLHFSLQQSQAGAAYQLQIPVAVTLAGKPQARQMTVAMQQKQQAFKLTLPAKPIRIDIDPEFDLFRRLAIAETPPAFTQLFGSQQIRVILPSKASPEMQSAWLAFAEDLGRMGPDQVSTVWDTELETFPDGQPVAVLGWDNRYAKSITSSLSGYDTTMQANQLNIAGQTIPRHNHAIALATRKNSVPVALITADLPASLPGLGRKLPHYHKYSYLAFSGEAPQNQLKGRWPINLSPMTALFVDHTKRGQLATREALSPL